MYGAPELSEQIARLALDSDCQLAAEEMVITTGCLEALFTALRSLCREGDIVAVESPTFPGISRHAANPARCKCCVVWGSKWWKSLPML